ncbi:hypothetical protein IJT93_12355 [bacterium]|nr:hypothetical protein [bacterium]
MDIFNKNNAKIAFASIAFLLAASAFSLTGCGEPRVCAQGGGSAAAVTAAQRNADIKVKFDFPVYQAVASEVKSFEFTLYNDALAVCYTKTASRSDFKQGCITLQGAPVSAKSLVCLFRDACGNPIGLSESAALELAPGAEVTVNNPDYASTAAELGERLCALRLSPSAPVKLRTGEKVQLKAEGVFSCRSGAELSCDLTSCSRLVWESSNNSLLRHLGGGAFKALSGGSVRAYASIGQKQAAVDIIVRAAASPGQLQQEDKPADSDAERSDAGTVSGESAGSDTDPITAADPEPVPVESPCALNLDLSRCCLPAGLSIEVRGYDINNRLRFRSTNVGLKESLAADRSVAKVAGVLLEGDGQVYGVFAADVDLQGKDSCTLSNPRVLSGSELAACGEMVLASDKAVYDLGGEELVYEKNESDSRCVYVHCSAEVRYSIIPGVWAYSSAGRFLEKLCRFKTEDSESDEYGVFRFFEAGEYTVSVSYRGVTGVFSVEVIDSASPSSGDYRLNVDLSASNLPSGAVCELRGYSRRNTLLFSEGNVSDLNPTFEDVNKNVVRVVGVVKTSGGEPWGVFEQNVSLEDGEICRISQPAMLIGEQLAAQKGSLSFSIPKLCYYLEDKDADGYAAISASPVITYNYAGNWSESFGREDLKGWDAFALGSSPHLEYYDSADKCRLKADEPGQYAIGASYRGLTSASVQISVFDTPAPNYSVAVNFAAAGLPEDSALICCQLFKGGTAVSEEFIRSSASSLNMEGVSGGADGVVIKVKNASGQLIGLLYKAFSFSGNEAVLNNVSVASGAGLDAYIKSFSVSPAYTLRNVGEVLIGRAQAELSFNSGTILQNCDVSAEAIWSSSDMAEGAVGNSWRVSRAGELSLRASLGSKYADVKVYASGAGDDKNYQYAEADLSGGRAVGIAVYTPDGTSDRGGFGGKVAAGSAAGEHGADYDKEEPVADRELLRQIEIEGRAESEIEDLEEKLFSAKNNSLSDSGMFVLNKDEAVRKLDYINAKDGDTISGIYDYSRGAYYDAQVILGNEGITLPNGYRTSGKIIILAEIKDGAPLLDLSDPEELRKVLLIDYMMGVKNPFDKDGLPVLDRIRQDLGHECGYGSGGGVSGLEKVVISVADMGEGAAIAYTTATNCFPKSIYSNSNECEMITFNYFKYLQFDTPSICSNFAHEFSHLVSYNARSFRDMPDGYNQAIKAYFRRASDLEKGRADLCCFLCGFGIDDRTESFAEFKELTGADSLPDRAGVYCSKALDRRAKAHLYLKQISSYSIKDSGYCGSAGNSTIANYGQGCFFLAYLYDRYGLSAVKKFTESSPYDSEYQDIPAGASHKDYDMLARIVGEAEGRTVSFEELYEEYGKTLLFNSICEADGIPSDYRLFTLVPGRSYDSGFTPEEYRWYGDLPKITPVNKGTAFTESGVVPWSLNYYITPDMSYSLGPSTGIFGMWGSLTSRFKMLMFGGCTYERDLN